MFVILLVFTSSSIDFQDSLQGDLDIEYQSRLLASFSNESTGASGGAATATGASGGSFRNEGELLSLLGRKKGQQPPPAPPRLPRVFPFTTSKSQGTCR